MVRRLGIPGARDVIGSECFQFANAAGGVAPAKGLNPGVKNQGVIRVGLIELESFCSRSGAP